MLRKCRVNFLKGAVGPMWDQYRNMNGESGPHSSTTLPLLVQLTQVTLVPALLHLESTSSPLNPHNAAIRNGLMLESHSRYLEQRDAVNVRGRRAVSTSVLLDIQPPQQGISS
jgi:hypothetical protein